jgi:hypothetical protein
MLSKLLLIVREMKDVVVGCGLVGLVWLGRFGVAW